MSALLALPNLRILGFVKSPYRASNRLIEDLPTIVRIKRTVMRTLHILLDDRKRWDLLVYFDTDMVGLYILSLWCRVEYLAIQNINIAGSESFEWFHQSLGHISPT